MTIPPTTPPSSSFRPLIFVLLIALAGAVVLRLTWTEKQAPEGKRVGNVCPEVGGLDPDDKPVKLSEYRGKVVLISFWATWCDPCKKLLPHEREQVATTYHNRPFAILGVAQDSVPTLQDFLKAHPVPWRNIVDDHRMLSKQWTVTGFPSAVLVDHQGVIRNVWLDGVNPTDVWTAVDFLVREAEKQ